MVYVVGGYILSWEKVVQWGRLNNCEPPNRANATLAINYWLEDNGIYKTRLLAVDYKEVPMYLVVTDRKTEDGTRKRFTPFVESERARKIKEELTKELGDVEYVTIADPYFNEG
jgi:hypothetical protein